MIAIKSNQGNPHDLELKRKLNLPLETELCQAPPLLIGWHDNKLAIFPKSAGPVFIDFVEGRLAHRRLYGGGKNQPLARAIGLSAKRNLNVIDATAGMGRDSFVLASLGCTVLMIERSPIIAALLEDALKRAQEVMEVKKIIGRLSLICADAGNVIPTRQADVIYLDPMFPEKRKSAAVKKDMQILQTLIGKDEDSDQLLEIALQHATHRVVIKRPRHAQPVKGPSPNTSISSPKIRYDIYTIKRL